MEINLYFDINQDIHFHEQYYAYYFSKISNFYVGKYRKKFRERRIKYKKIWKIINFLQNELLKLSKIYVFL